MDFNRVVSRYALTLLVAGLAAASAPAADDPVEKAGRAATEWIRIRSETVRVETEWREHRELLAGMIAALNERARRAEELAEEVTARTAKDRSEADELAAKNAALQKALEATDERLRVTAARLVALRPQLPPRLQSALELPFRSLQSPDIAVGERAQFATTIISRCLQFNHLVTTGDEVLTIEGESAPKSLEVAYWGLSHGYALDRAAGKAWVGEPGPRGWRWTLQPDLAGSISRLLAVARDQADPAFVVLPATLQHRDQP